MRAKEKRAFFLPPSTPAAFISRPRQLNQPFSQPNFFFKVRMTSQRVCVSQLLLLVISKGEEEEEEEEEEEGAIKREKEGREDCLLGKSLSEECFHPN